MPDYNKFYIDFVGNLGRKRSPTKFCRIPAFFVFFFWDLQEMQYLSRSCDIQNSGKSKNPGFVGKIIKISRTFNFFNTVVENINREKNVQKNWRKHWFSFWSFLITRFAKYKRMIFQQNGLFMLGVVILFSHIIQLLYYFCNRINEFHQKTFISH